MKPIVNTYDQPGSCNLCGELNDITVTDTIDGYYMSECETVCKTCGHKDYWSYGHFESDETTISKCAKYTIEY